MYTANLNIFLFEQMSLLKFFKNCTSSNIPNYFDEKQPVKFEITTCEETNTKIKLQINECETYKTIHNFTAWIYNLKKSTIKKLRAYISLKIKKLSQEANEMLISVNWESTKFIECDSRKL